MAKRFIDTGLFDDEWFMDLSNEAKLLWIYMITRCNHAGIIRLNHRHVEFVIKMNSCESVLQELGNRKATLGEQLYFIPKFIEFQYPGFPKSNVAAQKSVLNILSKYRENPTVSELLPNSSLPVMVMDMVMDRKGGVGENHPRRRGPRQLWAENMTGDDNVR